jgi:hypothetical protein
VQAIGPGKGPETAVGRGTPNAIKLEFNQRKFPVWVFHDDESRGVSEKRIQTAAIRFR